VERYRIPDDVLLQEVGGEAVLLDLSDGVYFSLTGAGARMVQLIREHGETSKVVDAMAEEYEAGADQIGADLADLLETMIAHGLAQRVETES
jgi:hypothetical protein